MKNLAKTWVLSGLCMLMLLSGVAQAQVTIIGSMFRGTTPINGAFVEGIDGQLYATAPNHGIDNNGTIFKIDPATGRDTIVYNFCSVAGCLDGGWPQGRLLMMPDGSFYGTTQYRGANGMGTVFHLMPDGTLTTVYDFCQQANCIDGEQPKTGVVLGPDGNLYGLASGGAFSGGEFFQLTPEGVLAPIHSFCADPNCNDGGFGPPYFGNYGVMLANDGNFYGTTPAWGRSQQISGGGGIIFRIGMDGTFAQLHSFCALSGCPDGYEPTTLTQGSDGNLYGTTIDTAFRLKFPARLTTINIIPHPLGGIIQATDGNFYGTTAIGGAYQKGTIFKITSKGQMTTLYSFCATTNPLWPYQCTDGDSPSAGLMQATDGNLYGTTSSGGKSRNGTVFRVSIRATPFVKLVPQSGTVGTNVTIIGNGLSQATGVTFNGTAATFTPVSDTEIVAAVPVGATSGTVTVSTSTSTINSNLPFQVN